MSCEAFFSFSFPFLKHQYLPLKTVMVCATMNVIKSPTQLDNMEEDESEEDSQDSTDHNSTKRPQALFLNFTSDLSPQKMNKKKAKPKRQTAYRVNGVNILNR